MKKNLSGGEARREGQGDGGQERGSQWREEGQQGGKREITLEPRKSRYSTCLRAGGGEEMRIEKGMHVCTFEEDAGRRGREVGMTIIERTHTICC